VRCLYNARLADTKSRSNQSEAAVFMAGLLSNI